MLEEASNWEILTWTTSLLYRVFQKKSVIEKLSKRELQLDTQILDLDHQVE